MILPVLYPSNHEKSNLLCTVKLFECLSVIFYACPKKQKKTPDEQNYVIKRYRYNDRYSTTTIRV